MSVRNAVTIRHEQGKLRQELYTGPHHLVSDVAPDLGGEDSGPSPHDYLVAALGACTALTLRMYALRRGWPLENAEIVVTCTQGEDSTRLERAITLVGPLDDEQKRRLLSVADRCPIHRALTGRIEVDTALRE